MTCGYTTCIDSEFKLGIIVQVLPAAGQVTFPLTIDTEDIHCNEFIVDNAACRYETPVIRFDILPSPSVMPSES